jgi:hypothetical protein
MKSYSFADTECCSQNFFVQDWFSIHMTQQWLNTQKKCNWCFYHDSSFDSECYRMSVHSAEIVTNAVQTTAERLTDRASWKPLSVLKWIWQDIHQLCSKSTVKWGLYDLW